MTSAYPHPVAEMIDVSQTAPPNKDWLIRGLVAAGEVTAFAAASATERAQLGSVIAQGLVGMYDATPLGCSVVRVAGPLAILTTARSGGVTYRRNLRTVSGATVVKLAPWERANANYFSELGRWLGDRDIAVALVDCIQDIPSDPPDTTTLRRLAEIAPTTVALLRGNDTKPGVNGTAFWDAAHQRFWLGKSTMHPIEAHDMTAPWQVDLTPIEQPPF